MPTKGVLCEQILIQIYGGLPTDDAESTAELVASYLPYAIGAVIKQSYKENLQFDGVAYINNSFYYTFKDLSIISDPSENFQYSVELPQIPFGLGKNEGISSLRFQKDGEVSQSAILLSVAQWSSRDRMRRIPNKILSCPESNDIKIDTTLPLSTYRANVTMVSGGVGTNMDDIINVPDDAMPGIVAYIREQLLMQKNNITEQANDGSEQK